MDLHGYCSSSIGIVGAPAGHRHSAYGLNLACLLGSVSTPLKISFIV